MSIISQAEEILGDVQDIREAIVDKGGTVSTLSTFAQAITDLPTGGGMPEMPTSWTTVSISSTFTASSDGFLKWSLSHTFYGEARHLEISVNGGSAITLIHCEGYEDDYSGGDIIWSGYYPLHSGDVVTWGSSWGTDISVQFGAI